MQEIRNTEMLARAQQGRVQQAKARLRAREKENMVSHFPTIKGAEIRSSLPPCTPLTDMTEYLQILQMTRARQPKPKGRVRARGRVRQPMIHLTPSQEIPALQETESNTIFLQQETESAMTSPIQPKTTITSPEEQSGRSSLSNYPQTKKKSSLKPLMKMR